MAQTYSSTFWNHLHNYDSINIPDVMVKQRHPISQDATSGKYISALGHIQYSTTQNKKR